MLLHFYKMNGAGNDFIVIDNRDLRFKLSKETIAALCDRHRGVGADGLLAVEPSESDADFKFRYYNADGGEAEMCGNGARCFGRFTSHLGQEIKKKVTFDTIAGQLSAEILGENVRISMSTPTALEMHIPCHIEGGPDAIHSINTGVPHAICFINNLNSFDVKQYGAHIRYHDYFTPEGTNANFAQIIQDNHIAVRTYERGVEDETLACGTGVTAAALIHSLLTGCPSPVKVTVAGGDILEIAFDKEEKSNTFNNVTLSGPADFVFEGDIEI